MYYHLYLNAFKPGSMMQKRAARLNTALGRRLRDLTADQQGWTTVKHLRQGSQELRFVVHYTILRAELFEALAPGDLTELQMQFESQIPKQTRRNERDNAEGVGYSMAQWYPKLCEYDVQGWHHDPYVAREFYGVCGDFDVKITLPAQYVVGATGVLQNPEETGYGYELGTRDTIWVRHDPSIGEEGGEVKTWHFKAYNVHDFAWVADRDYLHEITSLRRHHNSSAVPSYG
ncbi:MAG: hypothetical protein V3U69_02105 [Bacteroidota bacterium]